MHHEVDCTHFVGRDCIGSTIVGNIECEIGNSLGREKPMEIEGIDHRDGDVASVVEKIDGLVDAGRPARAKIVGLHGGNETLGKVGLEVEHGGRNIVGHIERSDEGVDLLTCVSLAENPIVDVAKHGFYENVGTGYVEPEIFVVGEQDTDYGAGHSGNGVLKELAVGGWDVVRACTGIRTIEMDVGMAFGHETHNPHCGLATL